MRIIVVFICVIRCLGFLQAQEVESSSQVGKGVLLQLISAPKNNVSKIDAATVDNDDLISKFLRDCLTELIDNNNSIAASVQSVSSSTNDERILQNPKIEIERIYSCEISIADKSMSLVKFWFPKNDHSLELVQLINQLASKNWRILVQRSSMVERRQRVPNDPEFNQQKYLQLIQMPDAWDYGVSSITRAGDTAVIAIIDDGVDTGHVDLSGNLYRNKREIPWNGIDEDSNGYVDDYWGWNGGDNSPLIFNRESTRYGHGTSVASVMMASGNNGKGITGILWNTQLLVTHCYPTNGGSADVGVVNAMVYIFKQKKLFLASKGKKGANVVAVNMSVGIDNAFPDEFPIWCAMYDSLASVGVMCASSTTNLNVDVDDPNKGDIPSLCPSASLIVVSNTDENKNRASSGYGAVSVDIHATGQNMYLAKPTQTHSYPYAIESGTSFASPQVTATIAWLYSRSCFVFLNLWNNNPDSAIRLMRGWILSSAQSNATLVGKSTSGGYLQVLSAWDKMHQWCSANDIPYSTQEPIQDQWICYPNPISTELLKSTGIQIQIPRNAGNGTFQGSIVNTEGKEICQVGVIQEGLNSTKFSVVVEQPVAAGYYQLRMWNAITGQQYLIPVIIY